MPAHGDTLDAGPLPEVAAVVERAGFAGLSLSEHPVPGARWPAASALHPGSGTHASSGWFNWPGSGWANHAPPHLIEERQTPQ